MSKLIEKFYDDFQENRFISYDKNNSNAYQKSIESIYDLCSILKKNSTLKEDELELLTSKLIDEIHTSIRINGLYTFKYAFKTGIELMKAE